MARPGPGAGLPVAQAELRAAYDRQLRTSARESTLLVGIVAIVAYPAWAVFDFVLLPHRAWDFFADRVIFTVAIASAWFALRSQRIGGRWPQQTAFVLVLLPELGIAWMIPRSPPHLEAYLLGFSLAIYASAFVIVWRWQFTTLLVGVTLATTAGCIAVTRPQLPAPQIVTIAFYLTTAGALAITAQVYRHRSGWHRFVIEAALNDEHGRNQALLAELSRLSREDPLTHVANRRAWDERLTDELARARRQGAALSIIYVDLDHFKHVNDEHGHVVGDQVLWTAAGMLSSRLRATDYVARLGGDEFAIALPDTALAAATAVAEGLVKAARAEVWPGSIRMTFSLGVAELHPDDTGPSELMRRADGALYRAKSGRDQVCTEADDFRLPRARAVGST